MSPDLSTSRIYTDFQGLADLRRAAKQDSDQALEEVAAQFEAIFIQMMLKSMRDASLSEGIFDSDQSEMYMSMFDQQISLDLSSKGAFGIADMLVQQLANLLLELLYHQRCYRVSLQFPRFLRHFLLEYLSRASRLN